MPFPPPNKSDQPPDLSQFNTTQWSVVLLAGQSQLPQSGAALERLCRTYWKPLYAYVRRQGHSPQDAQDLTQEFFARLLEKKYLAIASKERGRFRSFLLKSLKHFLINDWVRSNARKRGGGQATLTLDSCAAERSYDEQQARAMNADSLYEKRWAMALLEGAMERLGAAYTAAGKGVLFEQLKPLLLAEGSGQAYQRLAGPLGLSEGAVKVAVHRLRRRFGEEVRTEVARTVSNPTEVDEELRCLMSALRG